jgi:hypothetical protein
MDKESGIRKRSTKGNTRERIRRGGHQQKKITKTAKVRVLYRVIINECPIAVLVGVGDVVECAASLII